MNSKEQNEWIRKAMTMGIDRRNEESEPSAMSLISGLIIVGMLIWGAYNLNQYSMEHPTVCTPYKVTNIGQCTEATSNSWSGTDPGSCRVELSNGVRVNMQAPVMLGDEYKICESK